MCREREAGYATAKMNVPLLLSNFTAINFKPTENCPAGVFSSQWVMRATACSIGLVIWMVEFTTRFSRHSINIPSGEKSIISPEALG